MTNQNEKPAAGYRGSFVYQQKYSYKLITLTVGLRTRHLIERHAGLPLAGKQDKPLPTSPTTVPKPCYPTSGVRRNSAKLTPEQKEKCKKTPKEEKAKMSEKERLNQPPHALSLFSQRRHTVSPGDL